MSFWSNLFKSSLEKWIENASDNELDNGYEKRRQKWAKTGFGGNGVKTYEMKMIEREMNKRTEEKWKKDPKRKKDPNFRWTDANRWDKD